MKRTHQLTQNQYPVLLYRVVYSSRLVFLLALLLVATFLLQPIARAEAEELVTEALPAESVVTAEDLTTTTDIPLPPDVVAQSDEVALSDPEVTPVAEQRTDLNDGAGVAEEEDFSTGTTGDVVEIDAPESAPLLDGALSVPSLIGTSSDSTGLEQSVSSSSSDEVTVVDTGIGTSSGPDELADEPESFLAEVVADAGTSSAQSATTTATTTETLPLVHETYSDAEVRFLKRDCVTVEGGAYYCQTRTPSGSTKDALIAEPDSGGDLEIFLVKDGVYHQLTFNDVDDAAPYYDGRSQTMVWHRLVGDAYVIYEYNFDTGEERALSRGLDNDMEPSRFGERTVWQRWIDGRWQVILHEQDSETQLTTADAHHVAPVIRGEIILWQTVDGSGQKQIETLDLLTGSYHAINDSESAALTNPRMMMVYEAVYENGDVITRGVDLKTGQVVALDALPAELPDEIPPSDSTGETRALIGAKPSQKESESESDGDVPPPLPPTASSSDPLTLDLSTGGAAISATTSALQPLTTFDLVIEQQPTTTVAATSTE